MAVLGRKVHGFPPRMFRAQENETGRAAGQAPDFDLGGEWLLDARPEELTAIILSPETLHRWCGAVYMESETLSRGRPDGLGMTIRVFAKGFLPHSFFFIGRIVDLVEHRYMKIAVAGDFEGVSEMWAEPVDFARCRVTLRWQVEVRHPYVRFFVRLLRPVFAWNHRWSVERACRLLQAEVDRRRGGAVGEPARPTFPHNLPPVRRWLTRRAARSGRTRKAAT
ncbi:hypothetical protein FQ775_18060 [Nitratireductor mangrovi]|uniref:SRPBCC family protein n=1 Tax=Nitratireductor mangrovi TaxID=2599600 RepID=A0A5B8L2Z1_9HYPH|nr:hypothetical protein [Nitratireductor mangrovi]QDZ02132.1 hypothetical protein FQ775_18060 [Nitratireductor mangrovi]